EAMIERLAEQNGKTVDLMAEATRLTLAVLAHDLLGRDRRRPRRHSHRDAALFRGREPHRPVRHSQFAVRDSALAPPTSATDVALFRAYHRRADCGAPPEARGESGR